MARTSGPLLRLTTLNADETRVHKATRVVPLLNPDSGRYLDGVTATVRLLWPEEYKAIEDRNRRLEKTPTGTEWKTDTKTLITEVLLEAIVSWDGIVSADNKPLPVCAAALQYGVLDDLNRMHLAGVAKTPAEVVDAEVVAASFREPAAVGPVAD